MPRTRDPESPRKSRFVGVYPSGKTSWCYKLRLPPDPVTGVRQWESPGGFATDYDAHMARNRRLDQLNNRINVNPEKASVADYLHAWLAGQHHLKGSTRSRYRQSIDLYIIPYLGHHKLRDLDVDHVRAWQTTLLTAGVRQCRRCNGTGTRQDVPCSACGGSGRLDAPLAPGSVKHARVTLTAALNQAVGDGKLPRNVVELAKGVKLDKAKPVVWDEAEITRFLTVIDQRDDAAFWRLALFTQLRPGEIAALKWSHIDLTRASIHVDDTRTVDEQQKRILGGSTKSRAGDRRIQIPSSCVDALRAHRDAQFRERQHRAPTWNDRNLVFPSRSGGIISPQVISGRLTRICRKAAIPRITPHGIRHTGASWMGALGEAPHIIAARLGHTSVAFTLDNYVHPHRDAQQAASERLDDAAQRLRDSS